MQIVGIAFVLSILALTFLSFIKKDLTSLVLLYIISVTFHNLLWEELFRGSIFSFLSVWRQVVLLLLVLSSLLSLHKRPAGYTLRTANHIDYLVILYLFVSVICLFKAPVLKVGLYGFLTNCSGCVAYLAVRSIKHNRIDIDKLIRGVLLISAIPAAMSIYETFLANRNLFLTEAAKGAEQAFYRPTTALVRSGSVFGDFLDNSFFLLLPLSVSAARLMSKRSLSSLLVFSFFSLALLSTQSRAVTAFFILSLVVLLFRRLHDKRYRRAVFIVVTAALIFSLHSIYRLIYNFDVGSSVEHLIAWDASFYYISKYPAGMGLGTAGVVSDNFQNILPEGRINNESWFLQIAVEEGYVGLVLFLSISILITAQFFRALPQEHDDLEEALIAIVWMLFNTISISGLFLHSWAYVAGTIAWILVGFGRNTIERWEYAA